MDKRIKAIVFLSLLSCIVARGANNVTAFSGMVLESTFHSISVYADYTGDANTNSSCAIKYRVVGAGSYRTGYPAWPDPFNLQYKASIVKLAPATQYEVVMTVSDTDGVPATASLTNTITTWNEVPTIGSVNTLSNSTNSPVTITVGGSSFSSYIQYGPSGTNRITIQCSTNFVRCMTVDADNVLVQNIDFIGACTNSVKLLNARTNFWVRNCTFKNFGWPAKGSGPGTVPDERDNVAILIGDTVNEPGSGITYVIIESCSIFDPNGGANDWNSGHPTGPSGIYIAEGNGHMVIRYNHVYSTTGANHYYNDGIGGSQNESVHGFVYKNGDVYGNVISEINDDAIEGDGGNLNVRYWGNYMTNCHVGISVAACVVGPAYVFNNIHVYNNFNEGWLKTGSPSVTQHAVFAFYNTVDNPVAPNNGIEATAGGANYFLTSRGNILYTPGKPINDATASVTSSYDYDAYKNGNTADGPPGTYAHSLGLTSQTVYQVGPFATNIDNFFPIATAQVYHTGPSIAMFSDDINGASISNPNFGAMDDRLPVMKFNLQPFSTTITNITTPAGLRGKRGR